MAFLFLFRDDKQFVTLFTQFLKKQGIDYEVIVAKRRYDGTIDDLLIEQNVDIVLKVHTETPLYLDLFGIHTNVNQYSPLIEDTEIFALTHTNNKIDNIKRGKLPVSSHTDNETKNEIHVIVNDDFSTLNIQTTSSFTGHAKEKNQYDVLSYYDYVYEDYEKYETKLLVDRIQNKKEKQRIGKEMDALLKKLKEKQKERLEAEVKRELSLSEVEDYSYEINSTGRYGFGIPFAYSQSFTTANEFIKKAGPNYILEAGRFIGGQITLEDKERTRTVDIHTDNPRSFVNYITIEIPDGYTVAGLDKLQMHIDNAAGAFISTAEMKDGKLEVITKKYYKNNREKAADWGLMMEFLDAASLFQNEKVLLKKK